VAPRGDLTTEDRVFQNVHDPERDSPGSSASWPALVGFVGLCLLVGAADAAATQSSALGWYLSLAKPPGTPPSWVLAPVSTALYVLMGTAAWLIWRRPFHRRALLLWGWQLLFNAAWKPVFFGLHLTGAALAIVAALVMLVGVTTARFARLSPTAGALLLPYLLWTCYAAYLNAGFWWLNPT
jgi:tryptophan-rich sensory protein